MGGVRVGEASFYIILTIVIVKSQAVAPPLLERNHQGCSGNERGRDGPDVLQSDSERPVSFHVEGVEVEGGAQILSRTRLRIIDYCVEGR